MKEFFSGTLKGKKLVILKEVDEHMTRYSAGGHITAVVKLGDKEIRQFYCHRKESEKFDFLCAAATMACEKQIGLEEAERLIEENKALNILEYEFRMAKVYLKIHDALDPDEQEFFEKGHEVAFWRQYFPYSINHINVKSPGEVIERIKNRAQNKCKENKLPVPKWARSK